MSTYSYQEIAADVKELKKKVEFILNFFVVTRQQPNFLTGGVVQSQATLGEVYRELRSLGPDVKIEPVEDGSGVSVPIDAEIVEQSVGAEVV